MGISDGLYDKLVKEIERRAPDGDMRFHSERELSTRFGVARLTARRVIQRLESHGYVRQEAGRGTFLAPRHGARPRTNSILLITEPLDPRLSLIDLHSIALLQTMAAAQGYHIVLASSRRSKDPHSAPPYQQLMEQQRADGVILHSVNQRVHEWFRRRGDPVVIIGSTIGELDIARVHCRDENYFEPAVAHLAKLGHRDLALIARRPATVGSRLRAASFEHSVRRHGLQSGGCHFFLSEADEEDGTRRIVRRLLRLPNRPTALVTMRVTQAAHVLAELGTQGVAVPGDMSVVSGWDAGIAHLLTPKLTTVNEPVSEMLSRAWQMLGHQIRTGTPPRTREATFDPELVVRGSTAAPR